MAVAYDIKAHPTVYGARQFRSRLEAKWASFFDLCGWQFEYEPFDLEGWSPDFLLGRDVLVEVKPINSFDEDVARKMTAAARAANWDGELLLLGVCPLFEMGYGPFDSPAIGWLGEKTGPEGDLSETWSFDRASTCISRSEQLPDFSHALFNYRMRMFDGYWKDNGWPDDPSWLKRAWDRAANRVQWHKK